MVGKKTDRISSEQILTIQRSYELSPWAPAAICFALRNHRDMTFGAKRGDMLSPRFLRMQAEKCVRSALTTTDLNFAADLKRIARDPESWQTRQTLKFNGRAHNRC